MDVEIISAIDNQNLLEFFYDGGNRIVEPHCYGITTAGNHGLRAFQVEGYTSSGRMGWKMFDMGKAGSITVLNHTFDSPRPGYKRGDSGMSKIFAQL